MMSVLSAAGIEPTKTNLRQCLPALAFAKSQTCLEANRLTYAADNYLGWDLSAPLAGLADDNQSRPRPDKSARTVEVPASKELGGAHSERMAAADDRFLDAKLGDVANAVAVANVARETWSVAIAGDVQRQ